MSASVTAFIKRHLVALDRTGTGVAPNTGKGMLVDKVAATSIASAAGVEPGDVLLTVNESAAADFDLRSIAQPDARVVYTFLRPRTNELLRLTTTCPPIGLSLTHTDAALLECIRHGKASFLDLLPLWDRGNWTMLEKAAALFPVQPASWWQRLFGRERATPATLLHGVARYEQGDAGAGMRRMNNFRAVEQSWATEFHAIRRYYLALEKLAVGRRDRALPCLKEAFERHPLDRIAERIQMLTGQRPSAPQPRQGERFPVAYSLPKLGGVGRVSFSEQVRCLQPHQVFFVCCLACYRANGPYHEFMTRFLQYATYFGDYVARAHVITEAAEATERMSRWLRGEQRARQAGAPFAVLHDQEEHLAEKLRLTGSPWLFVVDSTGKVLWEGEIDDLKWWNILALKLG